MKMRNRTFIELLATKTTKVDSTSFIKLTETKILVKPLDLTALERGQ